MSFISRSLTMTAFGACAMLVASCSAKPQSLASAQYWQRSSATSAIHMNGPKAQQMLQRDIANCAVEVRELARLNVLRHNMPGDTGKDGHIPDPKTPHGALVQYRSPARDAYLYAEDFEFQDFETCMIDKGWERVAYLPYDTAERARKDYVHAIRDQKSRTVQGKRIDPVPPGPKVYHEVND